MTHRYHIGQEIFYTIRGGLDSGSGSLVAVHLPGKITLMKGARVWIRLRSGESYLPTFNIPTTDPNLRPA